jgi:hypothetical protein
MNLQQITVIQKTPQFANINKEDICLKAFANIQIDFNDIFGFADKNGWRLVKSKFNDQVIYTTFEVVTNKPYNSYHCQRCNGVFNFPIEKNECIFCGSHILDLYKNKTRYASIKGTIDGINPSLLAGAVQDLQEHPVAKPEWMDWNHLRENVD